MSFTFREGKVCDKRERKVLKAKKRKFESESSKFDIIARERRRKASAKIYFYTEKEQRK